MERLYKAIRWSVVCFTIRMPTSVIVSGTHWTRTQLNLSLLLLAYNPNFPPFNQMAYPGMPPFYPPPQQFAAGASFMMSPKQPFNTFEDENAGSSTNYSHASGGPRMKGPSNGTADEKN